jgi:histidine kinase
LVAAAGMAILALTSELSIPTAFDRHLALMAEPEMYHSGDEMYADLYSSFQSAFTEALLLGILTSVLVAVIASLLLDRQITRPVEQLTQASLRIADGHYDERAPAPAAPAGDELAELARSFNRMAQAIEGAETLRRELVANVAHELRTPLATMKGNLEGMLDDVIAADPERIELLYREVRRLETLVNDLQELSRVEAGVVPLNRQSVAPVELAQAAIVRLELQFQDKGVALDADVPDNLPNLVVDPDRIGQVLMNLVGNALQYTPAGGRVTLSAHREGERIAFRVADTGIGIAAEHLPHIFTRFYRVDRSRSRSGGGAGIGLTIAKLLTEAHGGEIVAASAGLGQGSVFTLYLPFTP